MRRCRQLNYSHNQKQLLSLLFNEQGATRQILSERSGFSLLTVSKFVNTFIDDGIVIEPYTNESTGGRKAGVLVVNPDYAYALAVDIGASKVRIGVVSINGAVVEKEEIAYYKGYVPVETITVEELANKLHRLLELYGTDNIMGVGIGFSGIINSREKRIVFCPNIDGYNNLPLADTLQDALSLPVMLNSSARCMALAEQRFGSGHGVRNQIFVSAGHSISAGIILNGSLFSGSYGYSGEIGHLPVASRMIQCSCGNYDCLENYATLPEIRNRILETIKQSDVYSVARTLQPEVDCIDIPVIQQALAQGDKQISAVIQQVSAEIGQVLVGITNTLNPELIILGGGVFDVFPTMIEEIGRVVRQKSLVTNQQNLRVVKSALGQDCGLVGSATQIVNRFLDS